ncbi:MAG: triose-phosphate isomerase [Myxococcales bacterium]|jgi:triosephosphate isomerase|nr:triose-phosphate isomerase [Myxococcales bacterium]
MKPTPFIVGNWKMNGTVAEARALVEALETAVAGLSGVEIAIAPPFTALASVSAMLEGSNVQLAAQNVHWATSGAFTGEIAPAMLIELGCGIAIIGHSERRQFFGETDESVNARATAAIASGLTAIVCVGETLAEREAGETLSVVERQIVRGLAGLTAENAQRLVIAYEPVWAIGTGKVATTAQAQQVHAHIRALLVTQFGADVGASVRLQYGGSVKPDNAAELLAQPDIDGALVGGASLKAADFAAIVKAAV